MGVKMSMSQALAEELTPQTVAVVDGHTVGECLDQLVKKTPDLKRWIFNEHGEVHEYLSIFINKESILPGRLSKSVKDGDEVHILCLIGGG
ncbi:MAG: MoaD/ThiS family protein [Chloroflexota bacterium]